MELNTIEELVSMVKDKSIVWGEIHEDGVDLTLSDGNVLAIVLIKDDKNIYPPMLGVALLKETGTLQ